MNPELIYKYLENTATDDEMKQVLDWLDADPAHMRELDELDKVMAASVIYGPDVLSPAPARKAARRISLRRIPLRRIVRYAAELAAVAVVGVGLARMLADDRIGEWARRTTALEVPAGQYLSMELQDGTKVWLNSASSVEYVAPFFSRERRVKMDGEAYFEVQHDAQAPFVVSTNGLDIKVLGTRFNIRNDDNEHRVTTVLLEGAVKAYASGDEKAAVRLRPSQQLVFDTRTGAMRLTDEPSADRSINWIDGRFCFEHDTFAEIVAELKRYYNVDIRFMDDALRSERFSGDFRVEDGIYHIMSVLQLTYKFTYKVVGNDIEIYPNPKR